MCGACGSGIARAPWETRSHGATLAHLTARAAEAQELIGRHAYVKPFGPAGYTVRTPTGATTVHRDLDDLLARLLALAPEHTHQHATQASKDQGATAVVATRFLRMRSRKNHEISPHVK